MNTETKTISDLNILNEENKNLLTIFQIFNKTKTKGGRVILENFFKSPKSKISEIYEIQRSLKLMIKNIDKWKLLYNFFNDSELELIYNYLNINIELVEPHTNIISNWINSFYFKTFDKSSSIIIENGVNSTVSFLKKSKEFFDYIEEFANETYLQNLLLKIKNLFSNQYISKILNSSIKANNLCYYDYIIRVNLISSIKSLLVIIYELDSYISLSEVIKKYDLVFPVFVKQDLPYLELNGLYNLFINNPVPNDIIIDKKNFLFITGPNMAGKSTFLKSIGVCIYLAHLGLGVPAKSMKLTTFDSLFSLINVEENIKLGYSYFFSEVLRFREIKENILENRKNFIIIDEPFKGTNIKDAYDCTKKIIEYFLNFKNSVFIISSHIVELTDELSKYENIQFCSFRVEIDSYKIKYDYKLKEGICNQRLGMILLENEAFSNKREDVSKLQKVNNKNSLTENEFDFEKMNNISNNEEEIINEEDKIRLINKKIEYLERLYWWKSD